MVPFIMFNFERHIINRLLIKLVDNLSTQQWNKYNGTEKARKMTKIENKRRQDEYAVWC